MRQLPERILGLFPRGGTVDVLLDHEIARLTGEALATIIRFDEAEPVPRQVVAIGDGYVALGYSGPLVYHSSRAGAIDLAFEACEADEDGGAETCRPWQRKLTAAGGRLIAVDGQRVAYAIDEPYELDVLTLGGRARTIALEAPPDSQRTSTTGGFPDRGELGRGRARGRARRGTGTEATKP